MLPTERPSCPHSMAPSTGMFQAVHDAGYPPLWGRTLHQGLGPGRRAFIAGLIERTLPEQGPRLSPVMLESRWSAWVPEEGMLMANCRTVRHLWIETSPWLGLFRTKIASIGLNTGGLPEVGKGGVHPRGRKTCSVVLDPGVVLEILGAGVRVRLIAQSELEGRVFWIVDFVNRETQGHAPQPLEAKIQVTHRGRILGSRGLVRGLRNLDLLAKTSCCLDPPRLDGGLGGGRSARPGKAASPCSGLRVGQPQVPEGRGHFHSPHPDQQPRPGGLPLLGGKRHHPDPGWPLWCARPLPVGLPHGGAQPPLASRPWRG